LDSELLDDEVERGDETFFILSTPEGERRAFIYSAAWAKQQEKDNYQTTENGNGKQRKTTESRPRDPDPWSPPENSFPT
jgi:hypothetical protein